MEEKMNNLIVGKKRALILMLMAIIIALAMASCGNGESSNDDDSSSGDQSKPQAEEEIVADTVANLKVEFPSSSDDENVNAEGITLPADSTAIDVLFAYVNENDLTIDVEEGDTVYIKQIGSVKETKNAGWVFTVNDETVMEAADKVVIKTGDTVKWEFKTFDE